MPLHEHTCKNRKTCRRPTAVSWGPYLLPSPQPTKGKYSVNLAIPAAHLPFPAKLHPMRQVQEVSKKAERPTGSPCLLLYHIILFHIFYMAFFYHNISGIFGHLLHKPWQTRQMHCRASLGLAASSAPMVRTIPLARAARSSTWLLSMKGLNSKQPKSVRPACPGAAAKGNKRLGLPIQRPLGSTHALWGKAVREKKISAPC